MKLLKKLDTAQDYDSATTMHKNLDDRASVVEELMKTLNKPRSYTKDDGVVVINEEVPRCGHEYDCCGCLCHHSFEVDQYFTEEYHSVNL